MDSTELNQLVRATRSASAEQRRVVFVMGKRPIDSIFAASGVERAF